MDDSTKEIGDSSALALDYTLDTILRPCRKGIKRARIPMSIYHEIKPEDALQWQRDPASMPGMKMCKRPAQQHLLPATSDFFKWLPAAMHLSSPL